MAGIKGVKSGNMAKLKGLTEQQLFKMKKDELIDLLVSTSKTVTANVRRLKGSKYENLSPFLAQRKQNKYPLPREIKRKTAQRMDIEQLKQELRDLAYTARLKTSSVSGAGRYVKEFEKKTGKSIEELISVEKAKDKLINKLIEAHKNTSGEIYTKNEIIAKYGDKELNDQAEQIVSDRWVKIREKIEDGYDSTSAIKSYDINKEEIGDNIDELEKSSEAAKQEAEKDLSNKELYEALK